MHMPPDRKGPRPCRTATSSSSSRLAQGSRAWNVPPARCVCEPPGRVGKLWRVADRSTLQPAKPAVRFHAVALALRISSSPVQPAPQSSPTPHPPPSNLFAAETGGGCLTNGDEECGTGDRERSARGGGTRGKEGVGQTWAGGPLGSGARRCGRGCWRGRTRRCGSSGTPEAPG
jgi:hypothetical protein